MTEPQRALHIGAYFTLAMLFVNIILTPIPLENAVGISLMQGGVVMVSYLSRILHARA